jgi:hypothetical protein
MKNNIIKFPRRTVTNSQRTLSTKEIESVHKKIKKAVREGRIEVASDKKLKSIDVVVLEEFFQYIINMSYYECLVTDMSSLHDFPDEAEVYVARIQARYGKDFSKDKKLNIYDIVKKLTKNSRG